MKAVLYPYNLGSASCKSLAQATDFLRIKENGSFRHTKNHLVINYGNSSMGRIVEGCPILNHPRNVAQAIDKLVTFQLLQAAAVPVPEFTTSKAVAVNWLNDGRVVFARTKLRSSGGEGIITFKRVNKNTPVLPEEVDNAPLYTALFSKDREYRVHVFKEQVIDMVQKKKVNDFTGERNAYIRNHDNGWVFAREDVVVPQNAQDAAVLAVRALGLDFGAVDLAVNKDGLVCVFEVNTAPGLEGTTVDKYANAFVQYLQKQNGQENKKSVYRIAGR